MEERKPDDFSGVITTANPDRENIVPASTDLNNSAGVFRCTEERKGPSHVAAFKFTNERGVWIETFAIQVSGDTLVVGKKFNTFFIGNNQSEESINWFAADQVIKCLLPFNEW